MNEMAEANNWRNEFGIGDSDPKTFFANKAELNTSGLDASQSHVLRRAFDLLKLDGVLCTENIPLVYFKQVRRIESEDIASLHRKFWNHGGAPILVLVDPVQVHIYSGLVRPLPPTVIGSNPALVDTLQRASAAIREFLPTVESGEYFRRHSRSFDPDQRVDRDLLNNLQATRNALAESSDGRLDVGILDALLCRLVFVCYLFDREVIGQAYLREVGVPNASHLRDVLGIKPKAKAKSALYDLFRRLGTDFNGDLFSDDLSAEERKVSVSYIAPLDDFFRATNVQSGQTSFWPYDFGVIPVEAISAIYERFLTGEDKLKGAFYTPRFLAELVLDMALSKSTSLLGLRCFDPACGSGIFLVGLFNRMAEEWKQSNPEARNDRRARELRKVLCGLYGVDINPTACRITAFSLYLAYLDQLTPRDIQELQQKGHRLPTLVHYPDATSGKAVEGNIWCGDFFTDNSGYPIDVDLVVGNPPWGSIAVPGTPSAAWCADPEHSYPIPDKQVSAAFAWKAPHHLKDTGRVCFVLPHGTIFNHGSTALEFQRRFFTSHAVENVLNLVDYQFFLFEEARHPAIVLTYRKPAPKNRQHSIEYWAPKTDWLVTRAEVISVMPEDRSEVTVGEVLDDLQSKDAPQIWKQRYWATARDRRLIDRLSIYPRLRDHVRQGREENSDKPWLIAEGFQPTGKNDDVTKSKLLRLPSKLFIQATSPELDLFLLSDDCIKLSAAEVSVRNRSNKGTQIFGAPHVLVSHGFTSIAFADFDVSFQHALRGISGPKQDRHLLIFLAAYLRSSIAKYFMFQTSSNWGVSRQKVHVEELLRMPFPLPEATHNPQRSGEIVREVAEIVLAAMKQSVGPFVDRKGTVSAATSSIEILLREYFDILPIEEVLIDDTIGVTVPSVRPTRAKKTIPSIMPSSSKQQNDYVKRLCSTLSGWTNSKAVSVQGYTQVSPALGVGVTVLQKTRAGVSSKPKSDGSSEDVLVALDRLRQITARSLNTFALIRGAKVFDGDRLYVVKPIARRFWTGTAALNDADEIAGTILMKPPQGVA